jgi:chemotaxis response regulator CheB
MTIYVFIISDSALIGKLLSNILVNTIFNKDPKLKLIGVTVNGKKRSLKY